MPTEIRHVIFSEEEALEALRWHSIGVGRPFPFGAVMRIDTKEPPSVIVTSAADKDDLAAALSFSTEQLLTALLLFCHKKRIPLPVRGSKEIAVVSGRLMLIVTLLARQRAGSQDANAVPGQKKWRA
jgi:hypothetical protein